MSRSGRGCGRPRFLQFERLARLAEVDSPTWPTSGPGALAFPSENPKSPSLQQLRKPSPDSSTKTLKVSLSPRKAIPVGKFRPFSKTNTLEVRIHNDVFPPARIEERILTGTQRDSVGCDRAGTGCRSTTSTAASTEVS